MRRAEPQPSGVAWLLLTLLGLASALHAPHPLVTHLHRPTATTETRALSHSVVHVKGPSKADVRARQRAPLGSAGRSRKDAVTLTLLLLAAESARAPMSR